MTDQNGTQIQPESVSGSVYTYSVNGITSERVLSILYKEATPAAAPTENTEDVAKDDAAKDQAQEDVAQADDQKEAETELDTGAKAEDKTSDENQADSQICLLYTSTSISQENHRRHQLQSQIQQMPYHQEARHHESSADC